MIRLFQARVVAMFSGGFEKSGKGVGEAGERARAASKDRDLRVWRVHLLEAGKKPGADDRRFAGTGRAKHGQHARRALPRWLMQPQKGLAERLNDRLAPEKASGVGLIEGVEAVVRIRPRRKQRENQGVKLVRPQRENDFAGNAFRRGQGAEIIQ